MRKLKLDDLQACLWHLQNANILLKGTEFDKLASAIDLVAERVNDQIFERLQVAKDIENALNEMKWAENDK